MKFYILKIKMATGKNSFVLYKDRNTTFNMLTDDEAGKLIKHLLAYVNDENPKLENRMLEILFEPIKQLLKRDLKKREDIKKKRSEAGKLGGIKKNKTKKASASKGKQKQANQAVSVSVSVSVLDINIDSEIGKTLTRFIEYRNEIKKPLSEQGLKSLKTTLRKLGSTDEERIAILEQSMVNNWQGVFELKNKESLQKKPQPKPMTASEVAEMYK